MSYGSPFLCLTLAIAASCAMACGGARDPFRTAVHRSGEANAGPIQFTKYIIESAFRAEGVTTFDVNNAGVTNIVTRQFWYEYPPSVDTRHEISTPRTWLTTEYSNSYADWGADVDGDGLTDLIALPRQNEDIYWYRNPGAEQDWTSYLIAQRTAGERPVYENLFLDGRKELVFTFGSSNTLVWAVPGDDPTQPWVTTPISEAGSPDVGIDHHGMGVGDVNGDGRPDIIVATGWFEGPLDPTQSPWIFHREAWLPAFCTENPPRDPESCCSDMYAYDVNADGLVDILCSRPHNRGRWWIEQLVGGGWLEHPMDPEPFTSMTPYSESHSARFEDLDGDGIPEFITGKRKWAHGTGGEGSGEPAVLVYYKLNRDAAGVNWVRYDIDLDQTSGVGTQFEVKDVNRDGLPDIVISNKLGLFYFEQNPP